MWVTVLVDHQKSLDLPLSSIESIRKRGADSQCASYQKPHSRSAWIIN